MKSRKRLAHDISDTSATHSGLFFFFMISLVQTERNKMSVHVLTVVFSQLSNICFKKQDFISVHKARDTFSVQFPFKYNGNTLAAGMLWCWKDRAVERLFSGLFYCLLKTHQQWHELSGSNIYNKECMKVEAVRAGLAPSRSNVYVWLLALPWVTVGITMSDCWHYHERLLALPWVTVGTTMSDCWHYHEWLLALPWFFVKPILLRWGSLTFSVLMVFAELFLLHIISTLWLSLLQWYGWSGSVRGSGWAEWRKWWWVVPADVGWYQHLLCKACPSCHAQVHPWRVHLPQSPGQGQLWKSVWTVTFWNLAFHLFHVLFVVDA